jgi:hypothetical protein
VYAGNWLYYANLCTTSRDFIVIILDCSNFVLMSSSRDCAHCGQLQHGRGGLRMAAYVRSSSNNRNSQAGGRPTDEVGRASEQVISQNIAVGRHANAFGAQVQGMGDMLEELGESIELALNKREHEKAAMAASLTELRSALGIQVRCIRVGISSCCFIRYRWR